MSEGVGRTRELISIELSPFVVAGLADILQQMLGQILESDSSPTLPSKFEEPADCGSCQRHQDSFEREKLHNAKGSEKGNRAKPADWRHPPDVLERALLDAVEIKELRRVHAGLAPDLD